MTEMAMQSRKSKYGRSLFYPTLKKKSSANTNSKRHQISKKKKIPGNAKSYSKNV